MIAVSSAAPAVAASATPVTMLWSGFGAPNRTLANQPTQTVDGVKVTASLARPSGVNPSGNWTPTGEGRLKLVSKQLTTGDAAQTVTLDFSAPVSHVSLTIDGIDQSNGFGVHHLEEVYVPSNSTAFTAFSAGTKVTGSGTPSKPFRAKDDVNGDFTGPEYSVTLTWEEPISSLQIGYRQGVQATLPSSPEITISPVTFTPTVTA
ncbi:hypothetical protein [Brachybacterium sp. p3-SID957]|uniref:hypothetical protein n=1 Tax=Brachybacterium sp. p3-SID957 TaxID=2916049 RepID=UPI00223B469A|nr:hypothetical protein [Brachybacterium sp. p3-SID957]MCT1777151.1 hypothetical protein [Brachybacterium sp. p3-SID957]